MHLAEARRLTGLSQGGLEDAAGLPRGTVTDIERGKNKNPSHGIVTLIIRAFRERGLEGLTAEELFPVPEKKRATA